MQQERAQLHEEAQRLREEIQMLNSAIKWVIWLNITSAYCVHVLKGFSLRALYRFVFSLCLCSACQQQLPATGVPITRQRFDHMRQKFREYVQAQTLQNWKFWIVSFMNVN